MAAGPLRRPPKVPRPEPVPRVRGATVERLRPDDVDAFWSGKTLPLVEPDGPGTVVVTFCWRDPDAEQVLLFANRLTDETRLGDTLLERLPGTDLWHASYRMDSDWRASYSFLVQRTGEQAPWLAAGDQVALRAALDRGRPDPRNGATCRNRAGVLQSVVSLPDAPPQPWLLPRPDLARGAVTEHSGPDGRPTWLYEPPGVDPGQPLPLVVALDGEVWVGTQSLPTTLDNLLADGALGPVRAVLPSSGGRDARWAELGTDDGAGYVVDRLLPWVEQRRAVDRVAVAGQSLGGLTALRVGLLHPERIEAVVSHSASLWQDDLGALVDGFAERADRMGRAGELRVHLAHGRQEWVLAGPHQVLAERLRSAGVAVDAAEHNGGHDYAWWRGGIADGLRSVWGR
ncbi:alpha/beta fold hydrolase [Nocardioides sp. W7]|uniref:alpha/beta fold hydrolase n=1 Tax=Nocardioides sp. W7 TaxID=2931390 RepID=UPI001FD6077C|nr:alpha/beta fold hydrolase [Nocardioides sp. W7]